MSITEIAGKLADLEVAGLTGTVSKHAVLQVVDPHTLTVVVFADRDSDLIRQAITKEEFGPQFVTCTRGVITIKI